MQTPRQIVLATRNPGKLRELKEVLADLPVQVQGLDAFGDIAEPEETGATFAENARDKAMYYARATGKWCLADDSGLVVDALDGLPGVHSARYAAADCPAGASRHQIDQANNTKLMAALRGVSDENRTARFVCHLALSDGHSILAEAFDTIEGRIGHEAAGENGFGYDPLFYVADHNCTTAQLPSEEKNRISHRGKAVRSFATLLKKLLSDS